MKKWFKIVLISIVSTAVLLGALLAGFIYKVKNGFPVFYETEKPALHIPQRHPTVLLFSKTTGFRHGEAIDASKKMFAEMAKRNRWFLYETEEGGVFNAEQLAKFNVVIFNNSTGEVINDEQKKALEEYVENGGGLIGIHGSGDDSHHWDWYEKNLPGAKFSHHPLKHQLQKTTLFLEPLSDSTLRKKLPTQLTHTDEWYIFFENPRSKGFNIIYTINGDKIIPNGNMLWIKDKNVGMGKDHPVAWFKNTGKGRTFYTSIGHTGEAFGRSELVQLLDNAIRWAGHLPDIDK